MYFDLESNYQKQTKTKTKNLSIDCILWSKVAKKNSYLCFLWIVFLCRLQQLVLDGEC